MHLNHLIGVSIVVVVIGLAGVTQPVFGADIDSTWNGGSGSWESPSNWTHVGPGSPDFPDNDALTYDATVNAGNAMLDTLDVTVETLTLSGGTISETGNGADFVAVDVGLDFSAGELSSAAVILNPTATGTWSGGSITDVGVLDNLGTLDLTGTDMFITGDGVAFESTLINRNVLDWTSPSGLSTLHFADRARIDNRVGGTFTIDGAGDTRVSNDGGIVELFIAFFNEGTFVKSGAGTTEFGVQFKNDGQFDLNEGSVVFSYGGGISQPAVQEGTVSIAAGTSYVIDGALLGFDDNSTVNLDGRFEVRDGAARISRGFGSTASIFNTSAGTDEMVVTGGELRFSSGNPDDQQFVPLSSVDLTGGSIINAPSIVLAPTGSFTWTGGELTQSGGREFIVPTAGSLAMSGTSMRIGNTTLRNDSTGTWDATGGSDLNFNSPFANFANNGSLTIDTPGADEASVSELADPVAFRNNSTLTKTGTGLLRFDAPFVNGPAGVFDIQEGEVEMYSDGELAGVITIASLAELSLLPTGGRMQDFAADAVITGTGLLRIGADGPVPLAMDVTMGPDLEIEVVGKVRLNASLMTEDLNILGGTIDGPGDVLVRPGGSLRWDSGMVTGDGAFVVQGDAVFTAGGDSPTLDRRSAAFHGRLDVETGFGLDNGAILTSHGSLNMFSGNPVFITGDAISELHINGDTLVSSDAPVDVETKTINTGRVQIINATLSGTSGGLNLMGGYEQIDGELVLSAGTLTADRLEMLDGTFHAVVDPFGATTSHTVQTRYFGWTNSTISLEGTTIGLFIQFPAAGADLTVGDVTKFDGFHTDGALRIADKSLTVQSAGFANLGVLTDLDGGQLAATNGVALGSGDNLFGHGTVAAKVAAGLGSTITAGGGDLVIGDSATPSGFASDGELRTGTHTVTIHDLNAAQLGTLTTLGSGGTPGTVTVPNGAVVAFGRAIVGVGVVDTPDNPLKPLINNGDILGNSPTEQIELTGYVKGVGTFDNVLFSGTFSPGLSPSTVYVGSIAFGSAATLDIEIGGLGQGSQHDAVSAAGSVALDGELNVTLLGAFTPQAGDIFDILNFSAASGDFAAMNLPALDPGVMWNVGFLTTTGELLATIMGDISGDFSVGVGDLGLLGNQWGTAGSGPFSADITGDGTVNVGDLGALAANWGAAAGPSLGGARVVPLPSGAFAGGVLLASFALRRDRSARRAG